MLPVLIKSLTALGAVAGLTFSSISTQSVDNAYHDDALTSLTRSEVTDHAMRVFMRADQNGDQRLDVDEYTALSIVTVELARLKGFIAIENGDTPGVIALPVAQPASLSREEHIRVAAVSQRTFYIHARDNARMNASEFVASQLALFDMADRNGNEALKRSELSNYAQRQAALTVGV